MTQSHKLLWSVPVEDLLHIENRYFKNKLIFWAIMKAWNTYTQQ